MGCMRDQSIMTPIGIDSEWHFSHILGMVSLGTDLGIMIMNLIRGQQQIQHVSYAFSSEFWIFRWYHILLEWYTLWRVATALAAAITNLNVFHSLVSRPEFVPSCDK